MIAPLVLCLDSSRRLASLLRSSPWAGSWIVQEVSALEECRAAMTPGGRGILVVDAAMDRRRAWEAIAGCPAGLMPIVANADDESWEKGGGVALGAAMVLRPAELAALPQMVAILLADMDLAGRGGCRRGLGGSRDLPFLDAIRCTGCGDCIAVCPRDCLAPRRGLPALFRPHDCISCGLCALICPESAIQMAARWCG